MEEVERERGRGRDREMEVCCKKKRPSPRNEEKNISLARSFFGRVLFVLEKNREALASLSLLPSRASEIAEQSLVLSLPLSRAMTSPVKVKREKEKKEETHVVVDEPTIGTLRFPLSLSFACAVLSHLPFTPFVSPVKLSAHRNRSRTSARSSEEALEGARVRD